MTAIITHATERETTWQHSWQTIHAGVFKVGERAMYLNGDIGVVDQIELRENLIHVSFRSYSVIGPPHNFIKEKFISLVYNQMYGVHISLN